ncbi:MAG: hypothetical protein V1708_05125 [Candidatus Micrarchaeota archaeon]
MRGLVYSIITLMILLPVFFFVGAYLQSEQTRDEETVLKIRGDEISNYADSISLDVPRILDMTSKRALIAALNYIDVNGTPLNQSPLDAKLQVESLMLNGTIYNSTSPFLASSSNSSTLNDWAARMAGLGSDYGLSTNITVTSVEVKPHDSFSLNVSLSLAVNITDGISSMAVRRTYAVYEILSLEGFEDPLYPLNTNGFVKRTIARANGTIYGAEAVDNATLSKWYANSSEGPSFLDRMEGRLHVTPEYSAMSANQIGLDGFADLSEISAAGITVDSNKTAVDHLYFNNSDYDAWPVNGSAISWMKLDVEHAIIYGVQLLTG